MKNNYKTALGKPIDIDAIRLANEDVIAVGNMKVNARGDEIGPGGTIIRTRNEIMEEHYHSFKPESSQPKADDASIRRALAREETRQQVVSKVRGPMAKKILEDQEGLE